MSAPRQTQRKEQRGGHMTACAISEFDRLKADHARQYLDSVRAARARLERQRQRRTEQLERMECNAPRYDGMPKNPNTYADAMTDGVIKLSAVDDSISIAAAEWEEAITQAVKCLDAMPNPDYSELLERRYIDGSTWEGVAACMGMSRSWCHYSKIPALLQLHETMPSAYRVPTLPAI